MKESEAKKKRCPKVQVIIIPSNSTWKGKMITSRGDIYTDSKDLLCLGSACMMWKAEHKPQYTITDEQPNMDDCIPEGKGWEYVGTLPSIDDEPNKIKWRRIVAIDEGTCGLITK